jgi:hypothetical protein
MIKHDCQIKKTGIWSISNVSYYYQKSVSSADDSRSKEEASNTANLFEV